VSENPKSWTVTLAFGKSIRPDSYAPVNKVFYAAALYASVHHTSQKRFGQMTEEEAKAMAKLLNASLTD
jgi:hypothetical protein